MKKALLLFSLWLWFFSTSAQSIYFNNRYTLPGFSNSALNIIPTSDGGFFTVGMSDSLGVYMLQVVILDSIGQQLQAKWLYNPSYWYYAGSGGSLIQTNDGGYALAGGCDIANQTTQDNDDVMLFRFKSNGDTLWTKRFGGPLFETGHQCRQTSDGGFVIIATKTISTTDLGDVWLIRTDSLGNLLWEKTFGGPLRETAYTVELTPDGGFIIGAQTRSFGAGLTDAWVIKTDSLGNEEWNQTYGSPLGDCGVRALPHPGGGYILTWCNGTYVQFSSTYARPALTRIDSLGNIIWHKNYYNSRLANTLFIPQVFPNGDILAVLFTRASSVSPVRYQAWKFNSQGDSLWSREYTHPLVPWDNTLRDMRILPDKGFVMSGWSVGSGIPQEPWVLRADSCGYTHGIGAQPVAAFSGTPITSTAFQFQNQSLDGCRYYWSFGDGGTSTLLSPQHSYSTPGTYTVQLVSCAADRCDTTSQQVTIYPCGSIPGDTVQPVAAMQVVPGSLYGSFTFTSQSTGFCSLLWLFGDGNSSTLANPQHQYQLSGTYTISHIAIRGSLADTVTQQITVLYACGMAPADTLEPVAAMQIAQVTAGSYSFSSQSTEYCTLLWHFGDGDTSTVANPQHAYQQSGNYTVMHIATAGTRADTVTQQLSVVLSAADALNQQAALQLFPNPAANEVIVQCQLTEGSEQAIFYLYDAFGRQVHKQVLSQPQGQNQVPLYGLSSGIYFYQVMNNTFEEAKGKLVIMH